MEMEDIYNSILARMGTVLDADYQLLDYVELIEKNSWNQVPKGYGVRAKIANEVDGVNKSYTLEQTFESIISDRYVHSSTNDIELRTTSFNLRNVALDIYKDLIKTKAGLPGTVVNIRTLSIAEPEVDEEAKVIVQRFEYSVFYRISL